MHSEVSRQTKKQQISYDQANKSCDEFSERDKKLKKDIKILFKDLNLQKKSNRYSGPKKEVLTHCEKFNKIRTANHKTSKEAKELDNKIEKQKRIRENFTLNELRKQGNNLIINKEQKIQYLNLNAKRKDADIAFYRKDARNVTTLNKSTETTRRNWRTVKKRHFHIQLKSKREQLYCNQFSKIYKKKIIKQYQGERISQRPYEQQGGANQKVKKRLFLKVQGILYQNLEIELKFLF